MSKLTFDVENTMGNTALTEVEKTMEHDLMILGEGPHSYEMMAIVARINRVTPSWRLLGRAASTTAVPDTCYVAFEHDFADIPEIDRSR